MDIESRYGYLVIADITGYTAYLAGAELLHAQDVLAELLEVIVERFRPALTLSKLEGDAVFAYAPEGRLRDEALLEIGESTYVVFRDRIESIRRRTTCECNACRSIPNLDLKFIIHLGEYLPQRVAGVVELVGSDVNLAHSPLKKHITEATGWKAYILLIDVALKRMNLQLDGLHEQIEEYDHLGETKTFSFDLHRRYDELLKARRLRIEPEDADLVVSRPIGAAPVVIWDWLNDIQKRLKWEPYNDIRPVARPSGRMGAGARNHCAHGKNVVNEIVLDWRPFEYYTVEFPMMVQSRYLQPGPDGTQLTLCFSLKTRLPRSMRRVVTGFITKLTRFDRQLDTLVHLITEDVASDDL